jgi:hypothetical protein
VAKPNYQYEKRAKELAKKKKKEEKLRRRQENVARGITGDAEEPAEGQGAPTQEPGEPQAPVA